MFKRIMSVLPVAATLTVASMLLPALPAHADLVDVWTTYPSMNTCKTALLNLNNYCYGLSNGQALGLIDANFIVDELDQSLGVYYDDENVLPAPESATNPVVEIWNNTSLSTYIGPGTSAVDDAASGATIYRVPPHADLSGPAVDADGIDVNTELGAIGGLAPNLTLDLLGAGTY